MPHSMCHAARLCARSQGFCNGRDCQAFPIVIGEFGGYMRDCRNRCAKANPNCMTLELNVRL